MASRVTLRRGKKDKRLMILGHIRTHTHLSSGLLEAKRMEEKHTHGLGSSPVRPGLAVSQAICLSKQMNVNAEISDPRSALCRA